MAGGRLGTFGCNCSPRELHVSAIAIVQSGAIEYINLTLPLCHVNTSDNYKQHHSRLQEQLELLLNWPA